MALVKKKKPKPPKRGKFIENITLYKDNTKQKYLDYLKPSQVFTLEYMSVGFFKKKTKTTPGSLQRS